MASAWFGMTELTLHQNVQLLSRFIDKAGWRTSPRALSEAVPHFRQTLNADDLLATLRNLELPLEQEWVRLRDLSEADLPCLFIDAQGAVHLCEEKIGSRFRVYSEDAGKPRILHCSRELGRAVRLVNPDSYDVTDEPKTIGALFVLLRPVLGALLTVSFFTNIAALCTPIMIMVLYDRAIPTGSTDLILAMAVGVAMIVMADLTLRAIRARAVAYVGSQAETRLSLELFRKLSRLPLAELEKNTVGQQISRLKQFESLRDAFSGPVFSAVLDLPFLLVFISTIFYISVPIGWLILGSTILFVILAIGQQPFQKRLSANSTRARNEHQRLIYETIKHQKAVTRLGLESIWEERQAALATRAARHAARAKNFQLVSQALGQSVMTFSGVGAIILGTYLAMAGTLSLGGLIAIMALVWKALSPLQSLYGCVPQIMGFARSARQIERVLELNEIPLRGPSESAFKQLAGGISLENVSHRFYGSATLSLSQINIKAAPGEYITISGVNGSGKSALLDILQGLFPPTAGLVRFDGVNYQQISTDDLRNMISYARQEIHFFHGTIAQNLRFGTPLATDEEIWLWLDRLGLSDEVRSFPEGLDTRLTEGFRQGTAKAFFHKLNIVRCLLKPAAVYLFDDPSGDLGEVDKRNFCQATQLLKGQKTIIIASNDTTFISASDRCVFLSEGRVVVNDAGASGQKKVRALLEHAKGDRHVKP